MEGKPWKHNNMLREARLKEKYSREDGIYILQDLGINSDVSHIEVWKNGEIIDKSKNLYPSYGSKKLDDLTWEEAEIFQKRYPELEIIDGTGIYYSSFAGEYRGNNYHKDTYMKRGAKYHDYSNQEFEDIDERPLQTVKWAYLVKPGILKIATRSSKNPSRLWDTRLHRYLGGCGYGQEEQEIQDIKEFIDNDPNAYEGTWNDIKDEKNYLVLIYNRVYRATNQNELLNNIIKAGIYVDGNRIKSNNEVLTGRRIKVDEWDRDGEPETISLNLGIWEANEKTLNPIFSEEYTRAKNNYQALIDCLLLLGINFGNEIQISDIDKKTDSRRYGQPKGDFFVLYMDDNYCVKTARNSELRGADSVKVGDVLEKTSYSSHESDYSYVISVKNRVATAIDITKRISDSYYWGDKKEIDKKSLLSLKNGALPDTKKSRVYTIDLVNGYSYDKRLPDKWHKLDEEYVNSILR